MKKFILILSAAVCMRGVAQQVPLQSSEPPVPPEPPKKEKVEAMRIAFITQKLDLTSEEAQKFWPVYNEFQKKRVALHKKRREEIKNIKENLDSLSDKQIEAFVDGEMAFKQKNLDLEKEYHAKFKSILPIKKVAKLYRAEEQFTRHLLERLSERGMGPKPLHEGKKRMVPPPPPHREDED
jgi:Spy/CpxP family protein refolding chaperone